MTFDQRFEKLTGRPPFPWQRALYEQLARGELPEACEIPTGLGKTSVIAVWWLAITAGAPVPRRLVYVVNRRTVVDQTSVEVERLRANAPLAGITEELAVSTLRGQLADNRAWSEDPSRPAVISGTVDMIGSRLLFSGYRIGYRLRPLHAGFLGQDAWLVHDEAHLEPAFQRLVERIAEEQRRCGDLLPLRVTALTATARSSSGSASVLELSDADRAHPVVAQRYGAKKTLRLVAHGDGKNQLADEVIAQVLALKETQAAILVYLRTVDDVQRVHAELRKRGIPTQILTGTMRGHERDQLVERDPIYARFLPESGERERTAGTVALVSTSAGEVGVNLSSDHLVCDLSTFDAMAQRFGRVNRFGARADSEIRVVHPPIESLDPKSPLDERRARTLALLRALDGDASPAALSALSAEDRTAAFAPEPVILPATDVLFDAWALTTIRDALPGRPPVGPYLHGEAEWEPPTTQVAWREEVSRVTSAELLAGARDMLEDYPLKPHELLSDRSDRVADTLRSAANRLGQEASAALRIWIVEEDGRVDASQTLASLGALDRQRLAGRIAGRVLLLPALESGPVDGLLTPESFESAATGASADVADEWHDEQGPRRRRVLDADAAPEGMRLVRTIPLTSTEAEADDEESEPRSWSWFERPRGGDDEGSRGSLEPVLLSVHSSDVEAHAQRIVTGLTLPTSIARAVVAAARLHDIGKARPVWQRMIGNNDPDRVLAKAGAKEKPRDLTTYRHELGSMLDAERDLLQQLDEEERELALHLIAAHHGRARPHFPENELFDPGSPQADMDEVGARVMERFARLQRRYGRWGLAYLESLVRAADYAASAAPSSTEANAR